MDNPPERHANEGLQPGDQWEVILRRKLGAARYVLACLSHVSVLKRGYVQKEYGQALSQQTTRPPDVVWLVPVLLEKCTPPDYSIESLNFASLQWYLLYEEGPQRLIAYLRIGTLVTAEGEPATEEVETYLAEALGMNVYNLKKPG